jgi:serine protease Do
VVTVKKMLKKRWAFGLMVILIAGFIGIYAFESDIAAKKAPELQSPAMMVPANFSELAKEAQPGVVNIRTVKTVKGGGRVFRHFFGNPFGPQDPFHNFGPFSGEQAPDYKQRSLGSGFIIDRDGYIVTNNHVIEGADEIKVSLANDKEFDAEIVGRDPNTDLALIRIKGASDLTPLKLGDSDKLTVGSWVVAIGSPFGLQQTVTAGIVSAKGRVIGSGPYDDFIQTDASINPGNSGGPLLNMNGEVVGINTAIVAQGQGIGFAIPINLAQGIIGQLKEHGSVTRGWLGVGIQDLTPELAEYYGVKDKQGVLVAQVFEGDPADKAGIKAKDIIIEVNGKSIDSSRELTAMIAAIPVGQKTPIKILRDGQEKTVTVEIAKRPESGRLAKAESEKGSELGIQIAEMTPEMARRFGHSETEKGVLVIGVQPGSKAEEAGIQQGDLVKEVNRKPVTTPDELRAEIGKKDKIQLLVKRPNAGFVVIKIG